MKSKVKLEKIDSALELEFGQLDVGDWYDSQSCRGICIKVDRNKYYSLTGGQLYVALTSQEFQWKCRRINGQVKWRYA